MKLSFTLTSFLLYSAVAFAQDKSDNIWAFGCRMGLDFNSGSPVSIPTKMFIDEGGCASVCDKNTGELLFYTDGDRVWDRNHNVMPNGDRLTGLPYHYTSGFRGIGRGIWWFNDTLLPPTGSCCQGALIVPVPKNPNLYYIFAKPAGEAESDSTGRPNVDYSRRQRCVYYSVVDMSLNNGLGDVVLGTKGLILDTTINSERLTAVSGTDCTVWVISTDNKCAFRAWPITPFGLDRIAVVSDFSAANRFLASIITDNGTSFTEKTTVGMLSASRDGRKLALSSFNSGLAIFDFNTFSGVVSNPEILDRVIVGGCYGNSFSPDGTKLYASWFGHAITQYDLSSGNEKTILSNANIMVSYKLGPDGKMYFIVPELYKWLMPPPNNWPSYLDGNLSIFKIDFPDLPGVACNMDLNTQWSLAEYLPATPKRSVFNFSNVIRRPIVDSIFEAKDTILCKGNSLILRGAPDAEAWLWNDGNTEAVKEITQGGKYWVLSKDECHPRVDTYMVWEEDNFELDLGPDTLVCNLERINLAPNIPRSTYYWQDGSTEPTYEVNASGTYWVQVSRDGCTNMDTIDVEIANLQQSLGPDIKICKGDPIPAIMLIGNTSYPGSVILWSTGSTDTTILVKDTGIYWVRVTAPPTCEGSDTFRLISELCTCHFFVPNAFSPNGDGYNDQFLPIIESGCTISGYVLNIYNRFGERVFSTTDSRQGWDGWHKDKSADIGTYFFEIHYWGGAKLLPYYHKGDVALIR